MTFAGDLTFNPISDTLIGADGKPFKFDNPNGNELPPRGYDPGVDTYQAPPANRSEVSVSVSPTRCVHLSINVLGCTISLLMPICIC